MIHIIKESIILLEAAESEKVFGQCLFAQFYFLEFWANIVYTVVLRYLFGDPIDWIQHVLKQWLWLCCRYDVPILVV